MSEVAAVFRTVRSQWPDAAVRGSTMEEFNTALLAARAAGHLNRPVVKGESCVTAHNAYLGGVETRIQVRWW